MDLLNEWYSELLLTNDKIKRERVSLAPFLAVPTPVVDLIFLKCYLFDQPDEVRYLSVEIFDRYFRKQFNDLFFKVWEKESRSAKRQWQHVEKQIQTQTSLRMLSCIQLATKFIIHTKILRPKDIEDYLKKEGKPFTLADILSSEMRVWRTLNLKINFPSVLTFADLILEKLQVLHHLSFPYDIIHKRTVLLIDIVYLHHQEIYQKLFYLSTGRWEATPTEKEQFTETECNYLYVSAAILALAFTFTPTDVEYDSIYKMLSSLTNLSVVDIQTLSNVINQVVLS